MAPVPETDWDWERRRRGRALPPVQTVWDWSLCLLGKRCVENKLLEKETRNPTLCVDISPISPRSAIWSTRAITPFLPDVCRFRVSPRATYQCSTCNAQRSFREKRAVDIILTKSSCSCSPLTDMRTLTKWNVSGEVSGCVVYTGAWSRMQVLFPSAKFVGRSGGYLAVVNANFFQLALGVGYSSSPLHSIPLCLESIAEFGWWSVQVDLHLCCHFKFYLFIY